MNESTLDNSLHLGAAADNPHEAADAKSKRQRKRVKSYLNFSANFRNGEVDFSVVSPALNPTESIVLMHSALCKRAQIPIPVLKVYADSQEP